MFNMMKIFGWFFLLCGVLAIGACIFLIVHTLRFTNRAVSTNGIVKELVLVRGSNSSNNSRRSYSPLIEFKTITGETKEFLDRSSSNPPAHDVGDIVNVKYDPNNPNRALIYYSVWSIWIFPLIPLFLGPIFIALGILFLKL
jgi:hypothetical protein